MISVMYRMKLMHSRDSTVSSLALGGLLRCAVTSLLHDGLRISRILFKLDPQ